MFHGRNLLKFHNLKNSGQTELTGTPSDKRKIPSLILQFGFNLSINVMQNLEVYKEHDIDYGNRNKILIRPSKLGAQSKFQWNISHHQNTMKVSHILLIKIHCIRINTKRMRLSEIKSKQI